jgi:hypothetical protein
MWVIGAGPTDYRVCGNVPADQPCRTPGGIWKVNMERWCNCGWQGKENYLEKSPSQCHVVHRDSPGNESWVSTVIFQVMNPLIPWCRASWNDDSYVAIQEIPSLLWNLKVHFRVHNSQSLVPLLSQTHPIHTFPPYFRKIHSDVILSTPRSSEWSLPVRFSDQNTVSISSALSRIIPLTSILILSFCVHLLPARNAGPSDATYLPPPVWWPLISSEPRDLLTQYSCIVGGSIVA